jgi:SAM-dependent methyltransferase
MIADELPEYAQLLERANHAQYGQLRQIAEFLQVSPGQQIVDVACGDGWYSRLFASLMNYRGRVVATDNSAAYLARARASTVQSLSDLEIVLTDGRQLPFRDGIFDLAWCAHSMITLRDRVAVLREMRRVVKTRGIVAVLENDPLHGVMLPWPLELELDIRRAEWQAANQERPPRELDSNRRLEECFVRAGLGTIRRTHFLAEHTLPLQPVVRRFLDTYLADLRGRIEGFLDCRVVAKFDDLLRQNGQDKLLGQPNGSVGLLETLYWARV